MGIRGSVEWGVEGRGEECALSNLGSEGCAVSAQRWCCYMYCTLSAFRALQYRIGTGTFLPQSTHITFPRWVQATAHSPLTLAAAHQGRYLLPHSKARPASCRPPSLVTFVWSLRQNRKPNDVCCKRSPPPPTEPRYKLLCQSSIVY